MTLIGKKEAAPFKTGKIGGKHGSISKNSRP